MAKTQITIEHFVPIEAESIELKSRKHNLSQKLICNKKKCAIWKKFKERYC